MSHAEIQRPNPVSPLMASLARGLERVAGVSSGRSDLLPRSFLLEEAGPPAILKWTVGVLAALMAAFLLWAALVQIDEVATSRGQILPQSSVRPVQHREGGIVAAITVRDGQRVAAGATIARLVDTEAQGALRDAEAQRAALSFRVARLRAFLFDEPLQFDPAISGFDQIKAEEAAMLRIQRDAAHAQVATATSSVQQAASQGRTLAAREQALQRQVALTREELETRRALFEKGYATKVSLLAIERSYAAIQGDLAETRRQREGANAATSGAGSARNGTSAGIREDALAELTRAQEQLVQANQQFLHLQDRVGRLNIVAPVAGVVNGLTLRSAGDVIEPGARIAEIIPDRDASIAEVHVSPEDIGHVKLGDHATIKADSFDFGRYGGVNGAVTEIAANSTVDAEGHPYFRVRIKLEKNHVGPARSLLVLGTGMTVRADIRTGRKSLLRYLTRPISNSLDTAFTER